MVSLHICTSDAWGGLEIYAATLMAELQRPGCRVIALCKPESKIEEFLIAHNVECRHLPKYSKFSFSSLKVIGNLLSESNVDVVHVHFHKDIWLASMALRHDRHRKLFLTVYMGVLSKNDLLHRWIYRRVNAIFSSSHRLNASLAERYPVPKEKIHFLPYGKQLRHYTVDPAKRMAIRLRYHVRDDELLIGAVLRIDPGKGVLDFARSFLYLDPLLQEKVKYVILGEPTRKGQRKPGESPYEPHCEQYFSEIQSFIAKEHLAGKIIIAGYQDDVPAYLSAMDMFVFPSHDEMYSIVVLEAMAMKLPVIAARAGGNIEQITDGSNGVLYEVGNSKELGEKISFYASHPELRKQHAAAGRSFVEQYHDMDKTIEQLLNYYGAGT